MTRGYYRMRWQRYFHALDDALRTGAAPQPIDWYALGEDWSHGQQSYSDRPAGDAEALASQVASAMHRGGCP